MTFTRRQVALGLLLIGLLIATFAVRWWTAKHSIEANLAAALDDPEMPQILSLSERIGTLHLPKRPPQPGDWLDQHSESGQTFYEYLSDRPKRVVDQYSTLYVQPLGPMTDTQAKLAREAVEMLAAFYDLPVKMLDPLPLDDLPESAQRRNRGQRQFLTSHLLDEVLAPRVAKDAAAVLGLTATDLWAGEGWNFVFGEASLEDRVGVWSIARFGDADQSDAAYRQCLRRTAAVAIHETGHMLGIEHCIAYECGMNGANNLRESDAQPLDFCPQCTAKVWWTCRAGGVKRYAKLAQLAEQAGLADDAHHWRRLQKKLDE